MGPGASIKVVQRRGQKPKRRAMSKGYGAERSRLRAEAEGCGNRELGTGNREPGKARRAKRQSPNAESKIPVSQ
jgi:hypothetical protein